MFGVARRWTFGRPKKKGKTDKHQKQTQAKRLLGWHEENGEVSKKAAGVVRYTAVMLQFCMFGCQRPSGFLPLVFYSLFLLSFFFLVSK
jgi:hypothetical protein